LGLVWRTIRVGPEAWEESMRGYFGIGVERISKQLNLGNLMRSAHGFGASFFFTIGAHYTAVEGFSDTSRSLGHMPFYQWGSVADMRLPEACALVGIELMEGAVDLPTFQHPIRAAYVLGPERGSLSPELVAKCHSLVKIPTAFCINVAMAGAIVMYDRASSLNVRPRLP
jgi:tRNA G18 (ribose-2'-O)-methylase SpoU